MKSFLKFILQKIFGFDNYLFIFSIFIISKLKWDKKEKDFVYFLKLVPDGGIILDIGANIGIMTVHLAKKFRNSMIFAFEPIPHNLKALKRVLGFYRLSNFKIFECALGDQNGSIEMVLPVISSVRMQGLSHVVHESIVENNEGEKFSVPLFKLDEIQELKKGSIEGIKIDVENFEYFVLKGGEELIKREKPIIYCELWDNENRYQTIELLNRLGYSTNVLIKNQLVLYDKNKHNKQNFFFIPK